MAGTPDQPKPTFFWQGMLILLPVMLMAGFGVWAIWREHGAVEQEARQRAREILQSLPYNFAGGLAFRMDFLATQSSDESEIPENAAEVEASEADGSAQSWGGAGNLMPDELTNNITGGASTNQWMWTRLPGEAWPMNFLFDAKGDFWDLTYQEAPQPPAWLAEMNDRQRAAWAMLREADANQNPAQEISRRVEDLLSTAPPAPARECAEFIRLRALSGSQSEGEALKTWFPFATNCSDVAMDTGLPLSNLVLAELLRRARPGESNTPLQKQLEFEVRYRPSLLTPMLLEEAGHLAAGDAGFDQSLKRLRALGEAREVQRELAGQIKIAGLPVDIGVVTNFWIYARDQRWLCVVQPERVLTVHGGPTVGTNQIISATTNVFTEVIPFPESFLAKSLSESLAESRIALPDYLGISIELEGQTVDLPAPWFKSPLTRVLAGRTLTEDQANLVRVLPLTLRQPATEDILAEQQITLSQKATRSEADKTEPREFDLLPSHPRLTFRVLLADRDLLYARQRERQVVFGGLMAFSVAAALIGFAAARRAFRTQLQLSEAKSNFVSSVSHELRAPIASVRLMAESLERGKVSEPAKQNEYFAFIVQECRRLTSLIENVLDFSRIEQGRKQYEFEPTDLVALTRETVKLMEPGAAEKGVHLKLHTSNTELPTSPAAPQRSEGGNLELNVDGRAIQQALVNLIDNAIKHSPRGETVTIEFEVRSAECGARSKSATGRMPHDAAFNPQPSTFNLSVKDHGPGIPPEEHEKIFERFYRRGSELRRETQGVGIGLSIVKHIVEAHGGRVIVRSAAGEGSRFTIELPIRK